MTLKSFCGYVAARVLLSRNSVRTAKCFHTALRSRFQGHQHSGGPLVALGVMTSIAIFCSIPASFLWGYLCDATRHYKVFILLSFLSSAIILFLMALPFAQNIIVFVVLYVVMQVLHVSHEAPKNVLIAEHYSRDDWEKSYGFYEGLTEIGFIIGLAIGLVLPLDYLHLPLPLALLFWQLTPYTCVVL